MALAEVEQAAHRRTVRMQPSEMASYLQDILGQRLTAVIAGVSDAKAVGKWARNKRNPQPPAEERLRNAVQVVQLLMNRESPETIRAWFSGLNPGLGDRSPALVIADEPARVLQVARAFLAHG